MEKNINTFLGNLEAKDDILYGVIYVNNLMELLEKYTQEDKNGNPMLPIVIFAKKVKDKNGMSHSIKVNFNKQKQI